MKASTFLIKSSENKSFGTAFCVATDDNGAFFSSMISSTSS